VAYVRKVRTASGAVAVQVVAKLRGRREILAHVGSAHTDAELGILLEKARAIALGNQGQFGFDVPARTEPIADVANGNTLTLFAAAAKTKGIPAGPGRTAATSSRLLYAAIGMVYDGLGFDAVGDEVFRDLVIARIVEPASKLDSLRVLTDLGANTVSYRTIQRHLRSIVTGKYRDVITKKCFAHSHERGTLSLLLYDVTTLYFEAENEDDLRKVGYSKERRVDPQIVVGLLVDRTGFPLEISCFEGNTAETTTIVPILQAFQKRHDLAGVPMVIAADAGMLSWTNLKALDAAGFSFIVGSRTTKAPAIWPVTSAGTVNHSPMGRSSTPSPHAAAPRWSTTSSSKPNRYGLRPPIRKRGGRSGSTKPPGRGVIRKPSTPKKPAPKRWWPGTNKPRSPGSSPSPAINAPSMKPASPEPADWSG